MPLVLYYDLTKGEPAKAVPPSGSLPAVWHDTNLKEVLPMASTEYILGFAAGLVAILIVFAVIRKATGGKTLKGEYDERQQLIRLKGYMYAF